MKTYRTVKAVIVNGRDEVLVLRRSETHPTMGHHEDLPGGVLEENEQPAETLAREINEETSIKVRIEDLMLIFAMTEKPSNQSAVRLVYALKLQDAEPAIKLSWEHDKFRWLSINDAIAEISDDHYTKKALAYL